MMNTERAFHSEPSGLPPDHWENKIEIKEFNLDTQDPSTRRKSYEYGQNPQRHRRYYDEETFVRQSSGGVDYVEAR